MPEADAIFKINLVMDHFKVGFGHSALKLVSGLRYIYLFYVKLRVTVHGRTRPIP